jgi:Asp-tRNA(Asn)/Glu-tRNA(Gln) amidotransferase A subunit family amidase
VVDAAVALDAVTGVDDADPITSRQAGLVPESYTSYLDDESLKGARIGFIPGMLGTDVDTQRVWAEARAALEAQGATLVEVTPPAAFRAVLAEGSGSGPEFNHDLQNYIDSYLNPVVPHRSLAQISASGNVVPGRGIEGGTRATYVDRATVTEETYQAWAGPNGTHTAQLAAGKTLLTQMMNDQDLDTIVYPTSNAYATISMAFDNPRASYSTLRLSPNTGLPAVTVPMGSTGAGEAGSTVGINLEFLGRDFAEGPLLGLAYDFEQATHARTTPTLFPAVP